MRHPKTLSRKRRVVLCKQFEQKTNGDHLIFFFFYRRLKLKSEYLPKYFDIGRYNVTLSFLRTDMSVYNMNNNWMSTILFCTSAN